MHLEDLAADDLETSYAYPAAASESPWVRVNFITTLDGAAQGSDGVSESLGNADDKRVFDLLRSLADVIVVGSGTAKAEQYAPVQADEIDAELRARLGLSPTPPIAVVSQSLHLPEKLVAPGQLVITTANAPADRLDALRDYVDVIAVGQDTIDWRAALAELAARGLRRILCEGGPSLHGTLVAADLVDELCLTIAPLVAASSSRRITDTPQPVHHQMHLGHVIQAGDLLLTRYTRVRP